MADCNDGVEAPRPETIPRTGCTARAAPLTAAARRGGVEKLWPDRYSYSVEKAVYFFLREGRPNKDWLTETGIAAKLDPPLVCKIITWEVEDFLQRAADDGSVRTVD